MEKNTQNLGTIPVNSELVDFSPGPSVHLVKDFAGKLSWKFAFFDSSITKTFMPRNSFTAIDFETATGKRSSICQVGLVRVMKGEVVDQINILVRPPQNEYAAINTQIHGINASMTARELTFDKVWPALEHYIEGQHLVAHNMAFDQSCLEQTLAYYRIPHPSYTRHCTYQLFGAKLSVLCQRYHIHLHHHDALSDARACARLFWLHLNDKR